jgi:hypothetical protein
MRKKINTQIPIAEFSKYQPKLTVSEKEKELLRFRIKEQVLRKLLKKHPTEGLKKLYNKTVDEMKKLMD